MHSAVEPAAPAPPDVPRWVGWILAAGAVALAAWALVVFGFRTEPSATGRPRVVLFVYALYSAAAAALGLGAALGISGRARWARAAAILAGAALTLSCVGAVAGVPALIGLVASRRASSN